MTNALRTVHRNKLKYYQALPPSEELTQCFIERYRGDHLTSFHVHRQVDSAFILGASCAVAMKGDFIFHTLQDMTWEAKMADIPHGELHVCASSFFNFECISYCCHNLTINVCRVPLPRPCPLLFSSLFPFRPCVCCLPRVHVLKLFEHSSPCMITVCTTPRLKKTDAVQYMSSVSSCTRQM